MLVDVVVITRSVVVKQVNEAEAGVARMNIVVASVRIVQLKAIDLIGALRNPLENRFDLIGKIVLMILPHDNSGASRLTTHLEILAEHSLFVFMRVVNFTFLQFKYHIAIRIG